MTSPERVSDDATENLNDVGSNPSFAPGKKTDTEVIEGNDQRENFQPGWRSTSEIDAATERRVVRKLDKVIMPLVFSLYLVAFIDRSNIGNARAAGMDKNLGFGEDKYEWLLTIFYIAYILFEWFAMMWKIIPPHIWAGVTALVWGLASTLQATAFNWEGLMVSRWFLAMAEAGFGPGVPFFLSFFYRRHELGLRCGLFVSAAPLATTFAGALGYALTLAKTSIEGWRLLFIVEGIPTIILAVVVFKYLPDSPDTASFLTEEEKEITRRRSILQSGKEGKHRLGGISLRDVLEALQSVPALIHALMYFSCNVSFASLPVFLPTILRGMGFTSLNAQGLTAPPYLLAFSVCLATSYIADRTQQRGFMIMGLSLLGGAGFVILATAHSVSVRYFSVFLAATGVFSAIANILPWVINNQGTDTKRGVAITVLNVIGQCGPLLGTRLFPQNQRPYYTRGMAVCAAFMFFNALLALMLRLYLKHENGRLERLEPGSKREAAGEHSARNGADKMDAGPAGQAEMEGSFGYRYVL